MTAVCLAVMMDWMQALDLLIEAKPNLELRHHRTGDTALNMAVMEGKPHLIQALLAAGANPDAANYFGATAREHAQHFGNAELFSNLRVNEIEWPAFRIQNAEHLADHYYPKFQIPERGERESLQPGQAVDVHVLGPKPPRVKVRIIERTGTGASIAYLGRVESPVSETNLTPETESLAFGPEHVATVWLKRPDDDR